jgi:kumamolisin
VHGADPDDVAKIEAFAAESNLSVEGVYPERRTVDLSGSTSDLSKAFQVDLALYEFNGKIFRAHAGPTYVPVDLVPIIQSIFGLDNRPVARRHFVATPIVINNLLDVAGAYNFPTGADGAGQTIGIIALEGGFDQNDLNAFWQGLKLANFPSVISVPIDGVSNNPGSDDTADKEVTCDIEVAGGIAPGAKIVVYFAPNNPSGALHAIQAAVGDTTNNPSVICMTFGFRESSFTSSDMFSVDQICQSAATSITIFCTSSDFGASDGLPTGQQVEFPGSIPHLTSCGGSVLTISPQGTIQTEIVWNEDPMTGATGGGVSAVFPIPAYQAGANVPKTSTGFAGRGLPDVAGHAAGISTQFTPQSGPGGVIKFAGTSAVSPLWSGLTARLNQLKGQPTGFLNEILYGRLAPQGALNDITTGDNGFYQAGQGWDACTGWGSPNGGAIANLLGPPSIRSVGPTAGPVSGGIPIIIQGQRFVGASLVSFGGIDTLDFNVDSDGQITVRHLPPSTTDGTVAVTVTTLAGKGGGDPNADFSYVFPVPLIQSINPPNGNIAGGDPISINGLAFAGATSVLFNQQPVTPTLVTDIQINVLTPTGFSSGPVDVQVVTPGGTSTPSTFTFVVPPPVVTGLNPNKELAGAVVTVNGTGFTGVIAVGFGATASPNVVPDQNNPDTQLTAQSPPGNGTVVVSVTTPGGTSSPDPGGADQFTYLTVPSVAAIDRNSGPEAGGTVVTITGTGFTNVTAVTFGATASPNVVPDQNNPDTKLTAVSPPGSGTVFVTVTTPVGTSAPLVQDQFIYVPVPVVKGINPNMGVAAGGDVVIVIGTGFTDVVGVAFDLAGSPNVVPDPNNPDTQLTAVSPPGSGTVVVSVTTPGGTSFPDPGGADQFTYQ